MNSQVPTDRLFTENHEWAFIENDIATIGITYYAQSNLGDVTYIEPPEVGDEVQQKSEIGSIESIKAVSDLFSPLTGKVTSINLAVVEHPEIINQDCYGEGWIFKLLITGGGEMDTLLSSEEYEKLIEGEK